MTTVSVDLAYRSYRDIGIVVVEKQGPRMSVEVVRLTSPKAPDVSQLAEELVELCASTRAEVLLIDGPQGWKDPNNGLLHSRLCERELNTPGKTGCQGLAKPGNYLHYIAFSIGLFDALNSLGWKRFDSAGNDRRSVVVESFPMSAWRSVGLPILPAKSKASNALIKLRSRELAKLFDIDLKDDLTHDELQALVAAIAGPSIEHRHLSHLRVSGAPPVLVDGHICEGYIVNPTRQAKS